MTRHTRFWAVAVAVLAVVALPWQVPSLRADSPAGPLEDAQVAPPGPPQNLKGLVSGNTVTLNWLPPTTGGPPSGYLLEAALLPGGPVIGTLPIFATSIVIPGVPNGTYYVTMRAVNDAGPGDPSDEIIIAVPGENMLAFVSERDGNSEIYIMNVDGTGLLRLTNDAGRDVDPAWSPDGKRIAFASDRAGSSDIYVMNADGSNLVRRTQTGLNEAPAWSPDGSKIAFSSLRDGQFGIYVMSVDGDWAHATRVGYDRGWNAHPAWSPDGGQIAFVSDWRAFDFLFDIYVMNADGSNITSLLAGPFFSRNGQVFYFQPAWSPDGRKMAVVVCGYARDNCYPSSSIAIANGDGLTTLVEAGGFARPTWSPDGSTIAFSSKVCRDCAGSLRYVSTDGTKSGLIFSNGHSPAWRP